MKKLLNTLYVTSQGVFLSKKGETIIVNQGHETKMRVPIHNLNSIVCYGNVMCSPFLFGLCGERNVTISFLTESGKFLARVCGPVSGNVLLRREQYRQADNPMRCSEIARSIVKAKIANSRVVLQRAIRDKIELKNSLIEKSLNELYRYIKVIDNETSLDRIRGIEGQAATAYFGVFDNLISTNKKDFFFKERNRRPPLDNMNALLSFIYTLLAHDVISSLEAVGLDPAVGYLHRDRPGRPSLALDMMEELRTYMADRLALSLVNRNQVKPKGFLKSESGAVKMDDKTRKTVLISWQKRKQDEIVHPFLQEKIVVGLLPHIQALLLSRYLRGDIDGYPPFLWR